MKKNVLSLSIAAMLGGLGFAGTAFWNDPTMERGQYAATAMRLGLLERAS